MIANLLNCVLGLWLVYSAVLHPAWTGRTWGLPIAGVAVILLALWARKSDFRKWQSNADVALGIVLLILAALHRLDVVTPLVMFWGVFWPGVLVAVIALWAALYRRRSDFHDERVTVPSTPQPH